MLFDASDAVAIARAATVLEAGELVAFPTETVYGLGARADVDVRWRRSSPPRADPPSIR